MKRWVAAIAICWVSLVHGPALAYPDRQVTLVVPFAAGAANDVAARLIANELTKRLKTNFIVENRAGAGGNLGAAYVARAKPDGLTLLLVGGAHAINKTFYKSLNYDIEADFQPVSLMMSGQFALFVHPSVKANNVAELIALAKNGPPMNYMSSGIGTPPHLVMELFKQKANIQMTHVPYKGGGPSFIDLEAGHVQLGFGSLAAGAPFVTSGKIRALAVTGPRRTALFPDVPTMTEAGYGSVDASVWYGIMAPLGTSREIVDILSRNISDSINAPEMQPRIAALGNIPTPLGPDEFRKFLHAEVAKWAEAVRASGASAD